MRTYRYDGTWEGLLCALYHAYEQLRLHPARPRPRLLARPDGPGSAPAGFFEEEIAVLTDDSLAQRVLRGIRRHGTDRMPGRLYRAFLSEAPGVEALLLDYLDALGDHGAGIERDVLVPAVGEVERLAKQVNREVHRMHAFVRFEAYEAADGRLWRAVVAPRCHVLPLLGDHFTARYPAMRWTILDAQRRCALCWDTHALCLVDVGAGADADAAPAEAPEEQKYQALWQAYFVAVDIPERRNPAGQQRHIPHRYRRYLSELRPAPVGGRG